MVEYTREDIIVFTDDPRLKDAIGKTCYFSDSVNHILQEIENNTVDVSILTSIEESSDGAYPFGDSWGGYHTCIIIKKELPSKYSIKMLSILKWNSLW